MAVSPVVFYRGAAATSSTTLYTAGSTEKDIITNIAITNTSGSAQTATITIDGTAVISGTSVPANSTQFIDLKQAMISSGTGKIIAGSASATSVNFHISGVTL